MAVPDRIMVGMDQLNRVIIIVSSAIKLVVGGSAMFVRFARSHQVLISGRRGCRPRVRSRVRLCVRS